jgi:hypothetical protein
MLIVSVLISSYHNRVRNKIDLFRGLERAADAIQRRSNRIIDVVTIEMQKCPSKLYIDGVQMTVDLLQHQS